MATNDLLKALGVLTGSTSGNLSAIGAVAKIQNTISGAALSLGQKIGAYTGGNIFSSLAKGANQADKVSADKIAASGMGVSLTGAKAGIFAVVALVTGYFLLRKK